jgi:hypothetical protein
MWSAVVFEPARPSRGNPDSPSRLPSRQQSNGRSRSCADYGQRLACSPWIERVREAASASVPVGSSSTFVMGSVGDEDALVDVLRHEHLIDKSTGQVATGALAGAVLVPDEHVVGRAVLASGLTRHP